jgi:mRNA interferase MazF
VTPQRGEVWWVRLDPTEGSEIRKTRPCLVLTADALNRLRRTVVVVPYSTAAQAHPPITVSVSCQGRPSVAVVDQVRAIARERLVERVDTVPAEDLAAVLAALAEILEMA